MVRKINVSLDALVTIAVAMLLSFGGNLLQRYQYSGLLAEHVDLQSAAQRIRAHERVLTGALYKCQGVPRISPSTPVPKGANAVGSPLEVQPSAHLMPAASRSFEGGHASADNRVLVREAVLQR